jgi:pimeloyl-ACP methyl ester carboxylesterase
LITQVNIENFPLRAVSTARAGGRISVLHSREDRVIAVELGWRLARATPQAEFHRFGQSGHWVQGERFEAFIALTRRHFS